MGVIYLQQLREHFASFRVQISLVVVVLFFVLNGVLAALRVVNMRQDDVLLRRDAASSYDHIETVADAAGAQFRVINEPTGTEFMTEGGFDWFWGSAWVSAQSGEWPWFYYARDVNMWMERFENLDWTLIVRLVLSFLCIVLAYDGIAGEAERGTLRLVLAYPISRLRVLLAKYAAQLTVLLTAFVVGALVSLVTLSVGAGLPLGLGLLAKVLLYGGAVAVYLSLFLLLSLGVSSLTRSSVSSLVLLTLVWAVVSVILPQSSYLVAMRAVDLPPDLGDAPWRYRQEFAQAQEAAGLTPRSPQLAAADDYVVERSYARALGDAENEIYRLGQRWLDLKVERYRLARAINLLSPSFAFQYTVEGLLGTGLAKRQSFLQQAVDFRGTLRGALRGLDAADGDSPHVLFLSRFMSRAPVDAAQLPRFAEVPLSPAQGLAFSVVPCVVLLAETLLAFLFALWAVNRADVTGYAVAEET